MINKDLKSKLFSPVDASFLTVFRIGFGVILLWEVFRYFAHDWITRMYINPGFYFKYFGFEWVHPWPGDGMYWHFLLLGLLAILIGIGLLYRLSTFIFFLAFSYVFLLDQTRYLNHFYLVVLFSFLLITLPANRQFAVDAAIWQKTKSDSVPMWTLWLLRAQVEILYLYAGIVKINSDWLQLEPLRMWLSSRTDMPGVGYLYSHDWAIAVAAYGVILLHVVGAPLLLWKKTRLAVFIIYVCFHMLNHFTFRIGIFPWFTILATTVFFDPDWPKQLYAKIKRLFTHATQPGETNIGTTGSQTLASSNTHPIMQNVIITFVFCWLTFQILFPLRHLLYPGNVSWTEEGHRFAWQMKLRDKKGFADFVVLDQASGKRWYVKPEEFLTRRQARKMATQPDMILQFAHFLEQHWKQKYQLEDVEVRTNNYVSLNGRNPAPMVDSTRDLTKIKRSLRHADWILPLTEPLHPEDVQRGTVKPNPTNG